MNKLTNKRRKLSVTIDRKKWLRGDPIDKYGKTLLLNKQGYRCYVGFVCLALGVGDTKLINLALPSSALGARKARRLIPYAGHAMSINDNPHIGGKLREKALIQLAAKYGHELKFIN